MQVVKQAHQGTPSEPKTRRCHPDGCGVPRLEPDGRSRVPSAARALRTATSRPASAVGSPVNGSCVSRHFL